MRLTDTATLTDADHALIEAARAALRQHYRPFWHMVAAALRDDTGRIWTGLHLGATVGRLQICAEAVALGSAVVNGCGRIVTSVAVRHPKPEEIDQQLGVVSPCGACREMFVDHVPDILVIIPGPAGLIKVDVQSLLPSPYRR